MVDRIDTYATHEYGAYQLRAGHMLPFGATLVARWRELLDLLDPRDYLHAGAVQETRPAAAGRNPVFWMSLASATCGR